MEQARFIDYSVDKIDKHIQRNGLFLPCGCF
jgi:hypothetical protein